MVTPRNSKDMHRDGSGQQCGEWHGEEMPMRQAAIAVFGAQTQRTTNYPFSRGAGLKSALRRAHEREDGRMGITDELRSGVANYPFRDNRDFALFEDIADRIDEEHRKAMDDSYRDGYQEGKRDGDDEWYEEHESYLEEHGWYQALDADKEVIHADDELFWKECGESAGRVTAIGVGRRAGWVWTLLDEGTVSIGHVTSLLRHKQPTVEDLLDEFVERWHDTHHDDIPALKAEYAAKLRLAGSDAE